MYNAGGGCRDTWLCNGRHTMKRACESQRHIARARCTPRRLAAQGALQGSRRRTQDRSSATHAGRARSAPSLVPTEGRGRVAHRLAGSGRAKTPQMAKPHFTVKLPCLSCDAPVDVTSRPFRPKKPLTIWSKSSSLPFVCFYSVLYIFGGNVFLQWTRLYFRSSNLRRKGSS